VLRRLDGCRLEYRPIIFLKKGEIFAVSRSTRKLLGALKKATYDNAVKTQALTPVEIGVLASKRVWLFKDQLWTTAEKLAPDEVRALISAKELRRDRALARAKAEEARGVPLTKERRRPIPREVMTELWQRDGAQCVECGAVQDLQVDHVIPLSLGGSGELSNLQILCAHCNQTKGTGLASR
jgi:HNH endonuclease